MASWQSPQANLAALLASSNGQGVSCNGDRKRKAESSGTYTLAKRVSTACKECRRRKVKCNGQAPCRRCGHLNIECQYASNCSISIKESEETFSVNDHISMLQDKINTLFANLEELRLGRQPNCSSLDLNGYTCVDDPFLSISAPGVPPIRPLAHSSEPENPRFCGPISSAFNFDVAESSLQSMGCTTEGGLQEELVTRDTTAIYSANQYKHISAHPSTDPLCAILWEEAIRLCRIYEEEIGIMYPILDIDEIISQTNLLYTSLDVATSTGSEQPGLNSWDALNVQETNIVRMVLAVTLAVEGSGHSDLGKHFFNAAKPAVDAAIWNTVNMETVKLLLLVAIYHFLCDDETLAYRTIGIVSRMCLELGLHRRDALAIRFPTEVERQEATRVFWSVYILDRRWSFGAGLPFVLQDGDIDPLLPEPAVDFPYLRSMVGFNRISSKVWYSGLGSEGTIDIKQNDVELLNHQVLEWQKQIPEDLQYSSATSPRKGEYSSRGQRRLSVLLYLRSNQMRILIHRPVLHSAASIRRNGEGSYAVVDIAKDTIRVLTRLNMTSDIYQRQQMCFNYFLVAALAVLFLAMSHAPTEFGWLVRDEFFMALDLVKRYSTESYASKCLWKTIKGLRGIADKLGLRPPEYEPNGADLTADQAIAGLACHTIESPPDYGTLTGRTEPRNSPLDRHQMSNELSGLSEAMGAIGNFAPGNVEGGIGAIDWYGSFQGALYNTGEGLPAALGNEGEFSRIMRDLFYVVM